MSDWTFCRQSTSTNSVWGRLSFSTAESGRGAEGEMAKRETSNVTLLISGF
jgi:hypothetical protein